MHSSSNKAPFPRSCAAREVSPPGRLSSPGKTLHPKVAGRPDSRQRPRFLLASAGPVPPGLAQPEVARRGLSHPECSRGPRARRGPHQPGGPPRGPGCQCPSLDPLPAAAAARPQVPGSLHRRGRRPRVPAPPLPRTPWYCGLAPPVTRPDAWKLPEGRPGLATTRGRTARPLCTCTIRPPTYPMPQTYSKTCSEVQIFMTPAACALPGRR